LRAVHRDVHPELPAHPADNILLECPLRVGNFNMGFLAK
jgi:hypothetical protein